jgi:hypothetical protein
MIWKSNLNQVELELIDDFGGKTHNVVPGAVPQKASAPEVNRQQAIDYHANCQQKLVPRTPFDKASGKPKEFRFEEKEDLQTNHKG